MFPTSCLALSKYDMLPSATWWDHHTLHKKKNLRLWLGLESIKTWLYSQLRALAKRKTGPVQAHTRAAFKKGASTCKKRPLWMTTAFSLPQALRPHSLLSPASAAHRHTNRFLMSLVSRESGLDSDQCRRYLAIPSPASPPQPLSSPAVLFLVCSV